MTKHENIAKALKARLSELTNRVVEIDSELRKPLSADLEEQATDLENQGALEAIETDPVVTVRENFVACDVLSQLQRVMDNPRFLLTGECEPLSAGRRVRIYATRGPYVCIYPQDTITPCKWTHEKVLSK